MNSEIKGLGDIKEFQKLAQTFLEHEQFFEALLRGQFISLTELACFLAPGGLVDRWIGLSPRQRRAFFKWTLNRNLRIAGLALSSAKKVKLTLATASLQWVLVVELVRTFSRNQNQGVMEAVEELRAGINLRCDFLVDHRFV